MAGSSTVQMGTYGNGAFPGNLPILNGKNYDSWCKQMRVVFGFQDVWDLVQGGVEPVTESSTDAQKAVHKELKKRDYKALFIIHQCVNPDNFERVGDAQSAKEAWDNLEKAYGGATKVKKVRLQTHKRQYELLQMEEKESVGDFITRVTKLVNLMKGCGETISDQSVVEKILRSLTPRFDIVVAIKESKDLSSRSVEELQSSLEAYEQKLNERAEKGKNEIALQVQNNNSKEGKDKWKKKKEDSEISTKNSKNQDEDSTKEHSQNKNLKKKVNMKEVQCYCCDKFGHYARNCPENEDSDKDEAQYADEGGSDYDDSLLMAITNSDADKLNVWYFDSGCSNHMTGNRSILIDFDECLNTKIKLANNEFIMAEGIGNVRVQMSNGKKAVIEKVLYVPGIQCNLLSVGRLISKGFKVVIENETLQLFDSKKRLFLKTARSKNMTYKTQFKVIRAQCKSVTAGSSQVVSQGIESILVKRKDGQEASITDELNVSSMESNLTSMGQLLEKNYSVKMQDKELKLVNAKDREILKAPMSNNKTLRMSTNKLEHSENVLRSSLRTFSCHCSVPTMNESQNWIWHHRYGHFHFRSLNLLNLKRIVKGLPQIKVQKQQCKESCTTKSTKKVLDKTPNEAWAGVRPWTGVRPSIGHFKVFGSLCLRYVSTHLRRNLANKGQAMIFLDYHSVGAYKLYSPTRNKMVACGDEQFDKAKSWNWSGNEQFDKAKSWNWRGNVVHRNVAASGVTTMLEETDRNEVIGKHELRRSVECFV
ncbi:hypothetical protein P8452_14509 [Trifolium repens]|nr:hypothetical protein P8452_14509 [Trifolium repens]